MVSKVKYGLLIALGEKDRYMGKVKISFKLKNKDL
jgi:hypothetical protein